MPPYPVAFEVDYAERRSRLTAFFRLILAIPLMIWVYLYSFVAYVAIAIAWFAIVITGRYPTGLYNFVAGYTRLLACTNAYTGLLCDRYPSFGGSHDPSYPVRMHFVQLERYSRMKTLFRMILSMPLSILRWVINLLFEIAAVGAWFVILITGRLPRGLFDVMVLANSYTARSDAYLFLLTETYPPFQDAQTRSAGVESLPGAGARI